MTKKDRSKLRKSTILIVSPPSDLQIGLQALLTTYLEADVYVTSEGSSALKAIARNFPDLVILDQDLPLSSGLEVTREIKNNWPDMRILVFVNNDEGKKFFSPSGVNHIIIKGLPGQELIHEIKTILQIM